MLHASGKEKRVQRFRLGTPRKIYKFLIRWEHDIKKDI